MLLKILVLTIFLTIGGFASEYAVIMNAHSKIEKLSAKQIKSIFLMKKHFMDGVKLIPLNSAASLQIRDSFEKNILHKNRDKLNKYWIKKHFQGIQPPVVQASVKAIKLFVKNVDGAIGYIPIKLLDSDLKVLYEF